MITVSAFNELSAIRHGFFTRSGGVSEGLFGSLNCGFGSDDDIDKVAENRSRAMAMLGQPADALVTVYQVHSPNVVTVDERIPYDRSVEADAMVTNKPGIALGILTADCAPVLFADQKAKVIGAAHAGWKGALGGVLENTLEAMEALGAKRKRIIAAVGPCISQRTYEVGSEFKENFLKADPDSQLFFANARTEGKFLFDLPDFIGKGLLKQGIKESIATPCDTCLEEGRFFSYRRATLKGEQINGQTAYGRQLSAIVLER